jgi:hypothetical protein
MQRRTLGFSALLLVAVALQLSGGRDMAREGPALPPPNDLSATVDHPFVPLTTVPTKLFAGEQLDEETGNRITTRVEETVVPYPAQVAGIAATVITIADYHNGQLHDTAADYFAQGADGTVYYVGEWVRTFKQGKIVNHERSWLSGDQGMQPGVFMPADPVVGDTFVPERIPDVAVAEAIVIAVKQSITTAAGTFEGCVVTKEVNFPEHTTEEKTYCPEVGLVREDFPGGHLELVAFATASEASQPQAVT